MPTMTIPTKQNIDEARGTLVLSVSKFHSNDRMHLITLGGAALYLGSDGSRHTLTLDDDERERARLTFTEDDIDLVLSWESDQVWVTIYEDSDLPQPLGSTDPVSVDDIFGQVLSLFEGEPFNGVYERLSTYTQPFMPYDLSAFSLQVFEESTERLFHSDFSTPTHYEKSVVIEDTFAPTDGSPILLSDDKGPLRRQFFFDEETSEYKNSVTETFTYRGEDSQRLAYDGIEPTVPIEVVFDLMGDIVPLYAEQDMTVDGQELVFYLSNEQKESFYGYDYTVTYQLERSYNIEFNEDVPHDGFRVNLVNMKADQDGEVYNSTQQVRLLKEGNRFENQYLAKEIELNPLVNPQVQGFLYIDTSPQVTQAFRIRTSSAYLNGNGVDTASVMIEAIDDNGNEVLSPYLSVGLMNDTGDMRSGLGHLEPLMDIQTLKARNTSGRAYYKLTAPVLTGSTRETHRVFVVVYDRLTGLGAQYPFYIQSVRPDQVVPGTASHKVSTEIPFEYFAREFERPLAGDHPMARFDVNQNGQLDRDDFNLFLEETEDEHLMQTVTQDLLDREGGR